MKLVELKLGVVRLPADIEIPLYLIREGLKAQKLFNDLASVGFDESRFYTDFSDAVLKAMGFIELTDELLGWYLELLEKYTKDLEEDNDGYTRVAFQIYLDVLTELRKRNAKR